MKFQLILFSLCLIKMVLGFTTCIHNKFSKNVTYKYFDDTSSGRLLQFEKRQSLRIFVDYSNLQKDNLTEANTIKRIMNISATYFYHSLKVNRLSRLYFPKQDNLKCHTHDVDPRYQLEGVIGDLGIFVSNEDQPQQPYVAKSTSCAGLKSNSRPIFGVVIFNNPFLKYEQHSFQQILFVGIHQIFHIIGFSAQLFDSYPKGNPLRSVNGQYYLKSPEIDREIKKHYNCQNGEGMPLEDQDGTVIPSHWEKKAMGNQFMIAASKKGSYVSPVSLALMQSTGWYDVNYTFSEKTTWGKDDGCDFLDRRNCNFSEFCNFQGLSCDWQRTGFGTCGIDRFTGTCKIVNYFLNTICYDEKYDLVNLNAKLNAGQRGGSLSKCFASDIRERGLEPTRLNFRCYLSVCSISNRYIYILLGSYIIVCYYPGQVIKAFYGLQGEITCPSDFKNQCENKETCPFHCNKNGACINGQCLCTGKTEFSQTCVDEEITKVPVGTTGGLLKSIAIRDSITGQAIYLSKKNQNPEDITLKNYSINRYCMPTTYLDPIFGQCNKCSQFFGCNHCSNKGCFACDDGREPFDGKCLK